MLRAIPSRRTGQPRYHFRRIVPALLRPLSGKTEISLVLHTGFVAQIPTKDSLFEFSLLAGYDEQAKTHALPNDELVLLQRSAEEAWVSDGVV